MEENTRRTCPDCGRSYSPAAWRRHRGTGIVPRCVRDGKAKTRECHDCAVPNAQQCPGTLDGWHSFHRDDT